MKKLLAVLLLSIATLVGAQTTFPNKPVRFILSLPAGSGPDVVSRKVAEVLSEKWGKPVIVENKPGGGGSIAINYLDNEPGDGYNIGFFDAGAIVSYPVLYNKPELIATIEPIRPLFTAHMALITSTDIKNFNELKQLMASNTNYGSWAVGSSGHLSGAEFGAQIRTGMDHVAYKEYPAWYIDISNKQIAYGFGSIGSSRAMREAGRIHYLGISASKRDPNWPNVPTIKELTGVELKTPPSWLAFYIRKSVDKNIKVQIEKDMREAARDPRVKEAIAKLDYVDYGSMSLPEFNRLVTQDIVNYGNVARKFNINVQ
jgi:tripartite-type tricarboxylate transporter receptor subunit TctC